MAGRDVTASARQPSERVAVVRRGGLVHTYPRGSWGPAAADAIAEVAGGWHAPDVPVGAGR